jgi:hypothetical protein
MGRRVECGVLDRLIGAVRAGESRALVLHGEAGVGKTALLEYLAVQALGCRVTRAAGVQSEMELAFAGLHQLCAPVLDHLGRLPPPQRDALRTVFGISSGPPPDRFVVGLAVLGLLSEAAERQPLVCLVDDQQWLDRASAQILAFVARRLGAESVGLVFAARTFSNGRVAVPAVEGLHNARDLPISDESFQWSLYLATLKKRKPTAALRALLGLVSTHLRHPPGPSSAGIWINRIDPPIDFSRWT